MTTTNKPFLTLLENGEELINSTLENSYKVYEAISKNYDLARFIRTTKFYVGKLYTLNEIVSSTAKKRKKMRRRKRRNFLFV